MEETDQIAKFPMRGIFYKYRKYAPVPMRIIGLDLRTQA